MAVSRAKRPELTGDGMARLSGPSFVLPSPVSPSGTPAGDLPVTGEPEVFKADNLRLVARSEKREWQPPQSDANDCSNGIDDDGDGLTDCDDTDCEREDFCIAGSAYR